MIVGQGTGTKGWIIKTKLVKKGDKDGVKMKIEESLWVEKKEKMTAQNAKKRETEVTPPRKSSVRRVEVKGPHRKKTTPKNIQEITPPTQERKCTRQTITVMNQEMITGIWTDSDVSPPETPKIMTNPIQARKITEMKVTTTSQENMKGDQTAEKIVRTLQKSEKRKIATLIRRKTRNQNQKGKTTQAIIVRINENDETIVDEEVESKEDFEFEESETEINLNKTMSSSVDTGTSSEDEVKPSTSNSSTDSSGEYVKPYNSITRVELIKDGSYYNIVNHIMNDILNKMGPYMSSHSGKVHYISSSE